MAEYGVATISDLMPHRRLRPPAADPPRPWNPTQPSPTSATHIGKRLAGKLHEPFERAGGGRAISPTSPDSTPEQQHARVATVAQPAGSGRTNQAEHAERGENAGTADLRNAAICAIGDQVGVNEAVGRQPADREAQGEQPEIDRV